MFSNTVPEIADVTADILAAHIDSDQNEYICQAGCNFLG